MWTLKSWALADRASALISFPWIRSFACSYPTWMQLLQADVHICCPHLWEEKLEEYNREKNSRWAGTTSYWWKWCADSSTTSLLALEIFGKP